MKHREVGVHEQDKVQSLVGCEAQGAGQLALAFAVRDGHASLKGVWKCMSVGGVGAVVGGVHSLARMAVAEGPTNMMPACTDNRQQVDNILYAQPTQNAVYHCGTGPEPSEAQENTTITPG